VRRPSAINRQNRTTGISEITPLTGHAADMPKSTRMIQSRHRSIQVASGHSTPLRGHTAWAMSASRSRLKQQLCVMRYRRPAPCFGDIVVHGNVLDINVTLTSTSHWRTIQQSASRPTAAACAPPKCFRRRRLSTLQLSTQIRESHHHANAQTVR
jgi:hypothetical protein